jgi:hypothetical protein
MIHFTRTSFSNSPVSTYSFHTWPVSSCKLQYTPNRWSEWIPCYRSWVNRGQMIAGTSEYMSLRLAGWNNLNQHLKILLDFIVKCILEHEMNHFLKCTKQSYEMGGSKWYSDLTRSSNYWKYFCVWHSYYALIQVVHICKVRDFSVVYRDHISSALAWKCMI